MMNRREFNQIAVGVTVTLNLSAFSLFADTLSAPAVSGEGASPRRVGVRRNGAYWGHKEEKIDVLSGNLSLSLPLIQSASRTLMSTIKLAYNSQNWSTSTSAGASPAPNTSNGFGWRLALATIVPTLTNGKVTGYTYVDTSGAEYTLAQSGSDWVSSDGTYLVWNPSSSTLSLPSGTIMQFASTSAASEPDAGSLHPTLVQCTNGNQVILSYLAGQGGNGAANTSGRIAKIQDARSGYAGDGSFSYVFLYSSAINPQLLSVTNTVGSDEVYQFSYNSARVSSPLPGDSASAVNTSLLSSVTRGTGASWSFQYNAYGELTSAQRPNGATLAWAYTTAEFSSGRAVREVTTRTLTDPSNPSATQTVSLVRATANASDAVHSSTMIAGPASGAVQRWTFDSAAGSPTSGLAQTIEHLSGSSVLQSKTLTWGFTSAGSAYVTTQVHTLDPGSASSRTSQTQFTRDGYGNLISQAEYGYDSGSTPARVLSFTYLQTPEYLAANIVNRRTSSTLQASGVTVQLSSTQYDTTPLSSAVSATQHDQVKASVAQTVRGNATETWTGGVYKRLTYDQTGMLIQTEDSAGTGCSYTLDGSTNNTLIASVIPSAASAPPTSMSYANGRLKRLEEAHGAVTEAQYDQFGRVTSLTSQEGGTATFTYDIAGNSQTVTSNGRWQKEQFDGLGRVAQLSVGDETGTQTVQYQVHGAVGGSPVGGLLQRSLPAAAGATPEWVNTTYDSLGRKLTQDLAATGAPRTFQYAGNSVQVTSPDSSWKRVTYNADRTIAAVTMPSSTGSSELVTQYSYNALGQLSGVSMPRAGATQTRRFSYDSGGRLIMSKQAESGQQTQSYNTDGTLASKTDAKGQKQVYTRDKLKRVVAITAYNAAGTVQPNESFTYFYDTNPVDSAYSQNTSGRLAAVQWGSASVLPGQITEMYTYTPAGHLAGKRLQLVRGSSSVQLDMQQGYDAEGRLASLTYPQAGPTLAYSYDSMGRLNSIVSAENNLVSGVSYNAAGQLTAMNMLAQNEGKVLAAGYAYNSRNHLTRILATPSEADAAAVLPMVDLQYSYRADNGRLASETDNVAGGSTAYTYDNHGRLATAQSNQGGTSWGLSFSYDGFGNRTEQNVTSGQVFASSAQYDPTTNWLLNENTAYDANGSLVSLPAMQFAWDTRNRLVGVSSASNGVEAYGYDDKNMRVWKQAASGREIITFYDGTRRLATYNLQTGSDGSLSLQLRESNIFFGKRMVQSGGEVLVSDRLGAVRAWSSSPKAASTRYLPFGEEVQNSGDSPRSFGGYERDTASGLDYAGQRYYASTQGRFISPDPFAKSAHPSRPDSWNRYSFVNNDPINRVDPDGLNDAPTSFGGQNGSTVSALQPTNAPGIYSATQTNPDGSTQPVLYDMNPTVVTVTASTINTPNPICTELYDAAEGDAYFGGGAAGVGTLMDLTGVGAPVGVALQAAGAVFGVFAAAYYGAAKVCTIVTTPSN